MAGGVMRGEDQPENGSLLASMNGAGPPTYPLCRLAAFPLDEGYHDVSGYEEGARGVPFAWENMLSLDRPGMEPFLDILTALEACCYRRRFELLFITSTARTPTPTTGALNPLTRSNNNHTTAPSTARLMRTTALMLVPPH